MLLAAQMLFWREYDYYSAHWYEHKSTAQIMIILNSNIELNHM